ncbi:NAD(P)-binding protein [Eremomyces bilateralis CBS 781.70]|uniref:NAD(P)-binding protein n=1 Tax=Eremomyces bilateralis CBS 781.70 TaxID=1392243 RepID=A0A6G1FWW8_9PEZI|nr:NAD(P)-binding protein [Eremomyces bilateralis CBS 781.70]KAF1810166.1 NAD(P)-binding protein [Eremomyces bilateralis CBS 781.70]
MADQQKYAQRLNKARILVLGGTSGIGFGVAEASLELGAEVIISSSNESRIKDTVARLQKLYPSKKDSVVGYVCDLGSEGVEENIVQLLDQVGIVDHIVYTAADKLRNTFGLGNITLDTLKKAGMVRLFAPILLAKHAPKHLTPGPSSSITLTSGSVIDRPLPGWSPVVGFSGGLSALTRNLALDLKPIRINLIVPGAVDTERWDEGQRKALLASFTTRMTTGQMGQVEDVVEAYLYAMKDRNLSGSVISTNGGQLLL